jgi:hypothetical protein
MRSSGRNRSGRLRPSALAAGQPELITAVNNALNGCARSGCIHHKGHKEHKEARGCDHLRVFEIFVVLA